MSNQPSNITDQSAFHKTKGSDYAIHLQEAMRYGELRSWQYPVAMSIMRALSQGHTEEVWKQEQDRAMQKLIQHTPDANTPHTEAANQYEQMVACFKDLLLWPW